MIYNKALEEAIKNCKDFLREVKELDDSGLDERDKQQKMRELERRHRVVDNIAKEIKAAGMSAEPSIREALVEHYAVNRESVRKLCAELSSKAETAMPMLHKKQIRIILQDTQPVFSKIAFDNLLAAPAMVTRMQNEMAVATALGESQQKVIDRIRNVMGSSEYCAKRIAQTERTRVQSQARYDTMQEAAELGIKMTKKWSARMKNTRDSHADLDGKEIPANEKFHTIWGNDLAYPGDPSAPAREVINCHCVMVPHVAI